MNLLRTLWEPWRKLFRNWRLRDLSSSISQTPKFHKAIRRECARSDRNGQGFALVVFDLEDIQTHKKSSQALLTILRHRLRSTDEAGWLNLRYVGVLLYGTVEKEDAWRFVNDVWERVAQIAEPPKCSVYLYPHDWRPIDESLCDNAATFVAPVCTAAPEPEPPVTH